MTSKFCSLQLNPCRFFLTPTRCTGRRALATSNSQRGRLQYDKRGSEHDDGGGYEDYGGSGQPRGPTPEQLAWALKRAALAIGGLGLAYSLYASLYNVEGGHRSIKYSRLQGILPRVFSEGTHFMIPWIERPIIFDCRARPRSLASLTGTKGTRSSALSLS